MNKQTEILAEQKNFSRILTIATIFLVICAAFQIITTITIYQQEKSSKLMLDIIHLFSAGLVGFMIAELRILFRKKI